MIAGTENRQVKIGLLIAGHLLMIGALGQGRRLAPDTAIHWRMILACLFAAGVLVTATAAYDTLRRGFVWLQTRSSRQSPWWIGAILLVWVLTGTVLMQHTQLIRQDEVTGDEPEYIMLCRSLLDESDFLLDVDMATGVCHEFMSGRFHLRGKSVRPPGLPVFLVPAYLAGRHLPWPGLPYSLFLWMGLVYVWLGMELFTLIQAATGRPRLAWFATLAAMLLPPVAPYAFQVYPELPAAALLVRLFRREFYGDNQRNRLLDGLCLALIPLFHQKYMFLFVMTAVALIFGLFLHARRKPFQWLALLLPSLVTLGILTWFFGHRFDIWLPTAPYSMKNSLLKNLVTWHTLKVIFAQFIDRKWGMLMICPLMVYILPGITAIWRRRPFVWVWWFATCGGFIVLLSAYPLWWGGFSPPARFLLPVVPLLWFGAAQFWAHPRSLDRPALTLLTPLLLLSILFAYLTMFGSPYVFQICSPYLYPEESPKLSALWASITGWFDWNQLLPAMERNGRWNHIVPDTLRFGPADWIKTLLLSSAIILIVLELSRKPLKNLRLHRRTTVFLLALAGVFSLSLLAWYHQPGLAIRNWHQSKLAGDGSAARREPVNIPHAYGIDSEQWIKAPAAKHGIFYPPIYEQDVPSAQWPGGYTYRFQVPVKAESVNATGAVVLEVENRINRFKQTARLDLTTAPADAQLTVDVTVPSETRALFKIVLYGDNTSSYWYRPVLVTVLSN